MGHRKRPYSVEQAIINGDRELLSQLGRLGGPKGGRTSGRLQRARAVWRQIDKDSVAADMEQQRIDAIAERIELMGLLGINLCPDPSEPDIDDYDLIPYEG